MALSKLDSYADWSEVVSRMADRNLQSYVAAHSGTPENPAVYHWNAPQPGEHYKQLPGHASEPLWEGIYQPRDWSDTLKFSGAKHIIVYVHGVLHGGIEDCIDANNLCENVKVICVDGMMPHGKYINTSKGGLKGIKITGRVLAHAKVVDFDLGNYSDQSFELTIGVVLDVWTEDGSAITYRQLNASTPALRVEQKFKCKFKLPGWLRPVFPRAYWVLKKILGIFK